MKIRIFSFLIATIASFTFVFISVAYGLVNVNPSSLRVVKSQTCIVKVTYSFTQIPYDGAWISNLGIFKIMSAAGEEIIGINSSSLSVEIANASGRVSEILMIPLSVIQKALDKGKNNFWYEREFSFSGNFEKATLNVFITTSAKATFSISKVILYFKNGKTNITVKMHSKDLKAYARINFTGSGLLKGYWEVDGRVFYPVSCYVSTQTTLLETPDTPSLPTFNAGTHVLRFVITHPQVYIELPALVYFVLAEGEKPAFITFSLFSPKDEETIHLPFIFTWEESLISNIYLIQFYEKETNKHIFSAYCRKPRYKLDERLLNLIFFPDRQYLWEVKSFTDTGVIIGQSEQRKFKIKPSIEGK